MVSRRSLSLFEPMKCAVSAFTPLPMPIKKPVNSTTSVDVEPTEPRELALPKLDTTNMSDRLKSTCRTLDNMSGSENSIICFHKFPCVRSFSLLIAVLRRLPYAALYFGAARANAFFPLNEKKRKQSRRLLQGARKRLSRFFHKL